MQNSNLPPLIHLAEEGRFVNLSHIAFTEFVTAEEMHIWFENGRLLTVQGEDLKTLHGALVDWAAASDAA